MPSKIVSAIKNKYFLSLSGNVIMSGLGMLTMAIIYRSLDIQMVGVWVLFQSTLLLVDTFRSGFLTTAFIKFYAGSHPERTAEIAGSAWVVGLCITGILVVINIPVMFFLNDIHDPGYMLFFKWSGLCFILMLPTFIATCVLQGEQRFDRMLYVRGVNQGGFLLFILVLIIIGKISLMGVLFSYLLSYFITSVYVIVMGWARINTIRHKSRKTILELYHFGKFSVGTTISANLFGASDAFIINLMLGKAALAVYNLGQSLMQLVEILLRSFAATAMPSLSAAYAQDSPIGVIHIMKKYIGMLTVVLIPIIICGWALADLPIYIIGGGKYIGTQAANVFRLFLAFSLLYPADRFFGLTLDVINRPIINFYKVLIMLAINISMDFLGIYIFGNIYGAALSTGIWVIAGVAMGYFALNNKYHKFSFWDSYTLGFSESKLLLANTLQKLRPKK
ncbi:lipopolysaccharide biosynthesis protein [Mucilaginibacter sp. E4BP6]|uniref:lipopolysaccharide biosynthesis protein n=1 Tax=Mucilaginibacter sp. E4BP6 TaxID=2723089 RepID=UPI0015CB1CDF|nr:oligosaccharide flippase family protein [Mucilaginibacter sp. E4BP6]NYE66551.1 O-antigen/teichoic acid export membrane protein [Mucilaginibacter sp. E4BP6]